MPTINSGTVPYGSYTVTVGSTAYVAESLTFSEASGVIERRDNNGDPSGLVIIPDFVSGSATLQRTTTATSMPRVGDLVAIPTEALADLSGSTSFYITETGPAFGQVDAQKFSVSFRRGV